MGGGLRASATETQLQVLPSHMAKSPPRPDPIANVTMGRQVSWKGDAWRGWLAVASSWLLSSHWMVGKSWHDPFDTEDSSSPSLHLL